MKKRKEKRMITQERIEEYCLWLQENERSRGTISKYYYYLCQLQGFLGRTQVSKEGVVLWKEALRRRLSPLTVNCALAAVNGFFRYWGWEGCVTKLYKVSREIFCPEERELLQDEYLRLIRQARENGNERMELLLQTMATSGIRVSELPYITLEAAGSGVAEVDCKGRIRKIFLCRELCRRVTDYARRSGITSGMLFITRTGRPMDRSNIWRAMKKLGEQAGVGTRKVFPHNLRHLFARSYYQMEKDLGKLADLLGHSSINTTRIYTIESGKNHIRQLEKLELFVE